MPRPAAVFGVGLNTTTNFSVGNLQFRIELVSLWRSRTLAALPYPRHRHGVPPAALASMVHCGSASPGATSVNIMRTRVPDADPLDLALRREPTDPPAQLAGRSSLSGVRLRAVGTTRGGE